MRTRTSVLVCILVFVAGCSHSDKKVADTGEIDRADSRDEAEAILDQERVGPARQVLVTAARQKESRHRALESVQSSVQSPALVAEHSAPTADMVYMRKARPVLYAMPAQRERYADYARAGIQLVSEAPVSTFSIDVDTGSYSNVRRFLNMGQLPPAAAVRVEELINYFSYDYAVPGSEERPFSVTTEVAPSPWNEGKHLMLVGLKGYEATERLPANLVFLVDVSGSMQAPNKLGLVKSALHMLVRQAMPEDRIAIVTYAGTAGVALEPTSGADKLSIDTAIDRLVAGGSTYGQGGLQEAYRLARQGFRENGINRVVLATDGDFNVGISDVTELKRYIDGQREHGISLTALGFGTGNYNDEMLEQLADVGNGNYAYIDNLSEARKVLVEQASSTFQTIASDVKIQLEFNPATVAEYRLVGYANRLLEREDFNNDKVDAGEIGAGHSVTALYEITLVDSGARSIDPLRYGGKVVPEGGDELAFVKLRFKRPGESASELIEQPVLTADIKSTISTDLKFASAVAGFGQLLAGGDTISMDYDDIISLAADSVAGDDAYRSEFQNLVKLAKELSAQVASR